MKKIIIIGLLLMLPMGLQGCNKPEVSDIDDKSSDVPGSKDIKDATKAVLNEYFSYISKFDQANLGNMKVELTNFEKNNENYSIICSLLTEAEAIQAKMNNIINSTSDITIHTQLKPLLEIMNARVAALKANKATFQRFGAS